MSNSKIIRSIEHYNEAVKYENSNNFKLAENLYFKAIQNNPSFFQAYYNLANIKKNKLELKEAVIFYEKTIELKSNFIYAYNNLGSVLKDLGQIEEAEQNFKKALELNPNFGEAKKNLNSIFEIKKLVSIVKPNKTSKNHLNLISNINTFQMSRNVETELINELYNIRTEELGRTSFLNDARFGHGYCSNFKLFDISSQPIKKIKEDLTTIMQEAVKSEIYIKESFFNILRSGSGTHKHNHISTFDRNFGYKNQKFSLTYYLSVGDQKASEPGVLKLYDPEKQFLPTDGLLLIFPAYQLHSAIYNGEKDRIMIGVNFYSLK
jgi:tetratricopeptide (TPR) repeat protein